MNKLKELVVKLKEKEYELDHLHKTILKRVIKDGPLLEDGSNISLYIHKIPTFNESFTEEDFLHLAKMRLGKSFVSKHLRLDKDKVSKNINDRFNLLIDKTFAEDELPLLSDYIKDDPEFDVLTKVYCVEPVYHPDQSLSALRRDILEEIKEIKNEVMSAWLPVRPYFYQSKERVYEELKLTQSISFNPVKKTVDIPTILTSLDCVESDILSFSSSSSNRIISQVKSSTIPYSGQYYLLGRRGKMFSWGKLM